ncbi:MAG TPA: DegT/DnrJ/EryC1/StrS family aminotransferase [Vicinamibacterales bacterium]|nr:DegT/DnrJ/EryC1/StrS family aminotransferase [Vicinamibacterales bacterium]
MRIGRTLPPAAAPVRCGDLYHALRGMLSPERSLRALEHGIRQYFGARHVFLVSSGKAALTLTLKALKASSPRTEVVIPAYTCFSIPGAVLSAGLRPVLCDINPSTFDFDHALLERTITDNTLCVVVHHLFGIPSNIEGVRALCRERGIAVIEDAAQAMGVEADGRKLGTIGDVGIFSLGRGKNITCGSGGILITRSDTIAAEVRRQWQDLESPPLAEVLSDFAKLLLMAIFIRPRLYWMPAALPFLRLGQTIFPKKVFVKRLSGMQAGLLHNWQSRLRQSNQRRSETAAAVSRALSLRLSPGPAHPYLRLPILAATPQRRDRIYSLAERRGLGVSLAYPTPINEIPEIRTMFDGQRYPSARRVSECILTIPTHQWISEKDAKAIRECVEPSATAVRRPGAMAAIRVTVPR